jgi:hypothetical protein
MILLACLYMKILCKYKQETQNKEYLVHGGDLTFIEKKDLLEDILLNYFLCFQYE